MTRLVLIAMFVGALLSACATRGTVWEFPAEVSTSGTGPFRTLTSEETRVSGLPFGRVIALRGMALESGMHFEGRLIYAAAARNEIESPEEATGDWAIDWTYFGQRQLFLSPETSGLGFSEGVAIEIEGEPGTSASGVFDPWLFRDSSGALLLLFATDEGVYFARADDIEGPYRSPTRFADASPSGRNFRRPTAIIAEGGGYHVYMTDGAQVYHAFADEGFTVGEATTVELATLVVDNQGRTETAVMNAAPSRSITPTGRMVWRLYFEAHRSDGTVHLGMAASLDGVEFERFDGRVYDEDFNPRFPAPTLDPPYTTRLIVSRDHEDQAVQHRALIGAVTPAYMEYTDPEEAP